MRKRKPDAKPRLKKWGRYEITWHDTSDVVAETWFDEAELKKAGRAVIVSIGYYVCTVAKEYRFVSCRQRGSDTDLSRPIGIPIGCVMDIKELK